jgi:AcrR family transcriptional regulator
MASTDELRITGGKVARRREAKIATIVEAAWKLSNEEGVAALSLHGLARKVGMRQPSLYEYFDSKNALYDAMFADGNRQLLDRLETTTFPRDPRAALKKYLSTFLAFALEDPARCELLFQRHIPGFTPSADSYTRAEQVLDHLHKLAWNAGVTDHGDLDCLVAITAGLLEAQLANDPKGNRWTRHLNHLVDLLVDDITLRRSRQ